MTKTMTRVEALTVAIAEVDNAEAVEVLTKLRDTLSKPRAKSTGKTPARIANEADAKKLYNEATEVPFGSDFVMAHTSAMTPQKVVGIMKVGIELGLFDKFKDGKKTLYHKL